MTRRLYFIGVDANAPSEVYNLYSCYSDGTELTVLERGVGADYSDLVSGGAWTNGVFSITGNLLTYPDHLPSLSSPWGLKLYDVSARTELGFCDPQPPGSWIAGVGGNYRIQDANTEVEITDLFVWGADGSTAIPNTYWDITLRDGIFPHRITKQNPTNVIRHTSSTQALSFPAQRCDTRRTAAIQIGNLGVNTTYQNNTTTASNRHFPVVYLPHLHTETDGSGMVTVSFGLEDVEMARGLVRSASFIGTTGPTGATTSGRVTFATAPSTQAVPAVALLCVTRIGEATYTPPSPFIYVGTPRSVRHELATSIYFTNNLREITVNTPTYFWAAVYDREAQRVRHTAVAATEAVHRTAPALTYMGTEVDFGVKPPAAGIAEVGTDPMCVIAKYADYSQAAPATEFYVGEFDTTTPNAPSASFDTRFTLPVVNVKGIAVSYAGSHPTPRWVSPPIPRSTAGRVLAHPVDPASPLTLSWDVGDVTFDRVQLYRQRATNPIGDGTLAPTYALNPSRSFYEWASFDVDGALTWTTGSDTQDPPEIVRSVPSLTLPANYQPALVGSTRQARAYFLRYRGTDRQWSPESFALFLYSDPTAAAALDTPVITNIIHGAVYDPRNPLDISIDNHGLTFDSIRILFTDSDGVERYITQLDPITTSTTVGDIAYSSTDIQLGARWGELNKSYTLSVAVRDTGETEYETSTSVSLFTLADNVPLVPTVTQSVPEWVTPADATSDIDTSLPYTFRVNITDTVSGGVMVAVDRITLRRTLFGAPISWEYASLVGEGLVWGATEADILSSVAAVTLPAQWQVGGTRYTYQMRYRYANTNLVGDWSFFSSTTTVNSVVPEAPEEPEDPVAPSPGGGGGGVASQEVLDALADIKASIASVSKKKRLVLPNTRDNIAHQWGE